MMIRDNFFLAFSHFILYVVKFFSLSICSKNFLCLISSLSRVHLNAFFFTRHRWLTPFDAISRWSANRGIFLLTLIKTLLKKIFLLLLFYFSRIKESEWEITLREVSFQFLHLTYTYFVCFFYESLYLLVERLGK